MTTKSAIFAIAVTLTVCLPALGYAQATTSGTAVLDTFPGQVVEPTISDATPQKWFRYDLRGGRSYCAEAGAVRFAGEEAGGRDPVVFIYAGDATTVIVSSDDASAEPDSVFGSRACFIAPSNQAYFLRLTDLSGGTHTYAVRLVETSLWASWFFIGGDYNAFTLLRNTTTTTISYTMSWRNPAGTIVGTTSGTVPANGGIGINARSFVGSPLVNFNGTVEVVHTASPEGLVGQVTSLSGSTGLGFDSTLFQRKAW